MTSEQERQPVIGTPPGSPEAGPVRVYRIDPETGEKVFVREEKPRYSEYQAGTTLEHWQDDPDDESWRTDEEED